MRWFQWLIIILLIATSNLFTYKWARQPSLRVKVVDLAALIDPYQDRLSQQLLDGAITADEAEAGHAGLSDRLDRSLQKEGTVFVKQCVLGKIDEDITERIRTEVFPPQSADALQ